MRPARPWVEALIGVTALGGLAVLMLVTLPANDHRPGDALELVRLPAAPAVLQAPAARATPVANGAPAVALPIAESAGIWSTPAEFAPPD